MDTNKMLLAGLVGGVVSFLLGWLIYGVALSGVMQAQSTANIMRADDQMVWWALILGNLSYGMLFAYIFGRWAGISNWMTGATAGATIGLLMALYFDLVMYATADLMTLQGILMDIVVCVIMAAVTGAAVAWMLGRGGNK